MIERLAAIAAPVLEFSYIRRTRRNHALEHATIHVLTSKAHTRTAMAGRSSDGGFILIGNVATADVESAAAEALTRMQRGEHNLAIHPNCGTNLVTTGALTTLAGMIGLNTTEERPSLDRISWTMVLMMAAVVFSQPLGMRLQKHFTTKGEPGDLEIVGVKRREVKWPFGKQPVTIHQVMTRRG